MYLTMPMQQVDNAFPRNISTRGKGMQLAKALACKFIIEAFSRRMVMASQENITQNGTGASWASILDGAAVVVVSPIVVPALWLGLKPVAKTLIKGSLFLTDTVKRLAMTAGDGWSDLVAEALSQERTAPAPGGAGTPADTPLQADAAAPPGTTVEPLQQEDTDDLQGITGIGSKWAALLEAAGVNTVHELARRNPTNLHEKLIQVNEQEHVVELVPSSEQITDWIVQAQGKVSDREADSPAVAGRTA
jgi:predicted flap endonuclease-1-like 5' DNA nuclease